MKRVLMLRGMGGTLCKIASALESPKHVSVDRVTLVRNTVRRLLTIDYHLLIISDGASRDVQRNGARGVGSFYKQKLIDIYTQVAAQSRPAAPVPSNPEEIYGLIAAQPMSVMVLTNTKQTCLDFFPGANAAIHVNSSPGNIAALANKLMQRHKGYHGLARKY